MYRELGDDHGIANASWGLGIHTLSERSLSAARQHFSDALTAYESFGDQTGATWALYELGLVEYARNAVDEADAFVDRALERMQRTANLPGIAFALVAFMGTAQIRGQQDRSLKLAGAADALRARTGADVVIAGAMQVGLQIPPPPEPGTPERRWWDEGAAMSPEEAIAFARVRNV